MSKLGRSWNKMIESWPRWRRLTYVATLGIAAGLVLLAVAAGGQQMWDEAGPSFAAVTPPPPVQKAEQQRQQRWHPGAVDVQAKVTYDTQCSSCHGGEASGDGPWHTLFVPPPANLTLMRHSYVTRRSIVINGVAGTQMPPHPDMDNTTIDGIFKFVAAQPQDQTNQWARAWPKQGQTAEGKSGGVVAQGKAGSAAPEGMNVSPPPPPVDARSGEQIFARYCVGCHGSNATGDGELAQVATMWPKPANLHARNPDRGRIYFLLTHGWPGTFMPPQQDTLPKESRWNLAQYVTELYSPQLNAEIPTPQESIPVLSDPYLRDDELVAHDGEQRLNLWCAPCHGSYGRGTYQAPRLIDRQWKYAGGTDTAVFTVVSEGITGKLMPSFRKLSEDERWRIITYVRHQGGLPSPMAEISLKPGEERKVPRMPTSSNELRRRPLRGAEQAREPRGAR